MNVFGRPSAQIGPLEEASYNRPKALDKLAACIALLNGLLGHLLYLTSMFATL